MSVTRETIISVLIGIVLCFCTNGFAQKQFSILPLAPDVFAYTQGTMLPLRPVTELLGAKVQLTGNVITVTLGTNSLAFTIGKCDMVANGKRDQFSVAPFTQEGITFIPFYELITALGGNFDSVADGQTYIATFPNIATSFEFPLVSAGNISDKSARDGILELYLVRIDGTGLKRLTVTCAPTYAIPSFSQNEQSMVYKRDNAIYFRGCMRPAERLLAKGTKDTEVISAQISPDGCRAIVEQQVIHDEENPEDFSLLLLNTDTAGLIKHMNGRYPCFSSDSKLIVYTVHENGDDYLYLADREGNMIRRIGPGFDPHFSPDNSWLVCSRHYAKGGTSLVTYVLRGPDAGKSYALSPKEQTIRCEEFQTFGADGKSVIMLRGRPNGGGMQVEAHYQMNYDRTGLHLFTGANVNMGKVLVARHGDAFVYRPFMENGLYVKMVKTGKVQLLNPGLEVTDFIVLPDGEHVVFSACTRSVHKSL